VGRRGDLYWCVDTCACVRVCVCLCACVSVCVCMWLLLCTSVWGEYVCVLCVCVCVCVCVCLLLCKTACVKVRVYVHCVCVYVHSNLYIYPCVVCECVWVCSVCVHNAHIPPSGCLHCSHCALVKFTQPSPYHSTLQIIPHEWGPKNWTWLAEGMSQIT